MIANSPEQLPSILSSVLQGDMCRTELLLEIEGIWVRKDHDLSQAVSRPRSSPSTYGFHMRSRTGLGSSRRPTPYHMLFEPRD